MLIRTVQPKTASSIQLVRHLLGCQLQHFELFNQLRISRLELYHQYLPIPVPGVSRVSDVVVALLY